MSVDVLSGVPAYLWDPPCDSWVSSLASLFFILGLLVASPIFLLLALDFTSYAIVRTLGIEHAHPVSTKATLSITTTGTSSSSSSTPSPIHEKDNSDSAITPTVSTTVTSKRPKNISIPHPQSLTIDQVQPFFTTPTGAKLELSGLFSPPESRTPSPPGSSFSFTHLDHQGTTVDTAQHATGGINSEEGQRETPRSEALPASGTGHWSTGANEHDESGVGGAYGPSASMGDTDTLGLLRRRKAAPGSES